MDALPTSVEHARTGFTHRLPAIFCLFLIMFFSIGLAHAAKPHGVAAAGAPFPAMPIGDPPIVPPQFDITGFIQSATLDPADGTGVICTPINKDPRLAGGTLVVNDVSIIVPCNTVLQLPATSMTWADLFLKAPAGTPAGKTGLALSDIPAPLTTYEVHVQGNIINGQYRAGLIFISQQSVNLGTGLITFIDYSTGELHLNGPRGAAGPTDVRVRLNDPIGRYGYLKAAPGGCPSGTTKVSQGGVCLEEAGYDARFTADTDNPTIRSVTGFPMCIPRGDPKIHDDTDCPQRNRPLSPRCTSLPAPFPPFVQAPAGQFCGSFTMDVPNCTGIACNGSDPRQQAPFEIGDYIEYMGTLKTDAKGQYISAHTVLDHIGIYTTPGVNPSYVAIDVTLAGTSALPVANLPQEATSRVKVEGFATDPSALVDIYVIDVDPQTGQTSNRLVGAADPGQPPVLGRWRFKPIAGAFLPPTREMRAVSRSLCGNNYQPCDSDTMQSEPAVANGLVSGQYRAPNAEFIFAENVVIGDPTIPANLQDLAFLFCGSGPLDGPGSNSNVVGQLMPPPWAPPMPNPIFAPVICPKATPLPVPGTPSLAGLKDKVTIVSAQWNNRNNRGKLNVIASSTLAALTNTSPPASTGLQLYIQATLTPAGGGNPIQLASAPLPMSLIQDIPGTPAVCPTAAPCWQFFGEGLFIDPTSTAIDPITGAKQFVPPTSITVTSNAGGKDVVPNATVPITVRAP